MANNQMHLPTGEEEIIQQVEAYTMAGISRAVLRGCIERGELRIADRNGSRGSARLYRSEVRRLMAEKGWLGPEGTYVMSQQAADGGRSEDVVPRAEVNALREELRRTAETNRLLRRMLAAVTE